MYKVVRTDIIKQSRGSRVQWTCAELEHVCLCVFHAVIRSNEDKKERPVAANAKGARRQPTNRLGASWRRKTEASSVSHARHRITFVISRRCLKRNCARRCLHMYRSIYIYMYIKRERERETSVYVYIYTHIHICIYSCLFFHMCTHIHTL